MTTNRYSDAQILSILRHADGDVPAADLNREHGMSSASFYKWRAKFGGMDASMISQMKGISCTVAPPKRAPNMRTAGRPGRKPGVRWPNLAPPSRSIARVVRVPMIMHLRGGRKLLSAPNRSMALLPLRAPVGSTLINAWPAPTGGSGCSMVGATGRSVN
jgi:hypothetical protein